MKYKAIYMLLIKIQKMSNNIRKFSTSDLNDRNLIKMKSFGVEL